MEALFPVSRSFGSARASSRRFRWRASTLVLEFSAMLELTLGWFDCCKGVQESG